MSAVELLGMAQVLGIIAVLTVLLQLVWFRYRQRSLVSDRVRQRLQQRTELGQELGQTRVVSGPLERLLLRADIRLSRTQLTLMGIVIFVMLALVLAGLGVGAGIVRFYCGCRGRPVHYGEPVAVLAFPVSTAAPCHF